MRLSRYCHYVAVFVAVEALTSSAPAQSQGPALAEFPAAVGRVLPCVVRVSGEANPEKIREFMAESFVSADRKVYSVGSGFFVSAEGKIVTANHVVAPITGDIIIETTYTGKLVKHKAVVLAQDKHADVAMLKVDGEGYPKVDTVDPIQVPVGEGVGFVGYPRGFPFPMVNKGIISAKVSMPLRQGLDARTLMALNAFVNPGNSGGPLFLERTGQVIGLVNARRTADIKERMIRLPADYKSGISLGNVDPIRLSVETYNKNLELIGDVSQFGIGFAASAEYILKLQTTSHEPESKK